MGLTNAMYTGLSGLHAHQTRVETIGHNIANVNTNAYKGSRTLFQTQFAQTLAPGTPPGETSGGTNPMQIGRGVMVGSTTRVHSLGALETTGLPSDLAVDGSGYFIVHDADGTQYFTRDGAFVLNDENQLVTGDGRYVQGWGVDGDFSILPGTLQRITIPLGEQITARATQNVSLDGVLSAASAVATAGSVHVSQAMSNGGGGLADANTALTDVRSAANGAVLFQDGDIITLSGASRGERDVASQQFIVGQTGNTLGDFANWLQTGLGIHTEPQLNQNAGVTIANGTLVISGNYGEPNAIQIQASNLTSTNPAAALPLQFTQTAQATGDGLSTAFTVYDSLGAPVPVQATFVLEGTPDTGPVWRYFLESADSATGPEIIGTGTVGFDVNGDFVSSPDNSFQLSRSGTGAATPLTFTLDLSRLHGLSTRESAVILYEQDGYPPGTLTGYSVAEDGTIEGVFSNGLNRTLGQVAVARFINEQGLLAESDNLYTVGPNSGPAQIVSPGELGTGTIRGGALEMSNVDLTEQFIGLITSSTGFQANSRVISVSNDMLDQLLLTLR